VLGPWHCGPWGPSAPPRGGHDEERPSSRQLIRLGKASASQSAFARYCLIRDRFLRNVCAVSYLAQELAGQPELWRRAAELAAAGAPLPKADERVALIGCGTSLFMAQAAASFRQEQGLGLTDAFPASEVPFGREYDTVIAISRSGTTTEVLEAVRSLPRAARTLAISATVSSPLADLVSEQISLPFADEQSIVQTRFATTALALLLSSWGWDIEASASQAAIVLGSRVPEVVEPAKQFVFLGRGMAAAIASEAALKLREVLGAWTESYPTMEFRHGPISAIGEHSLVWALDGAEPGIDDEIARTGAQLLRSQGDPLAELVRVHMAAAHLAGQRGIDADHPRFLSRSIILAGR
jgi:fructoselysine-6-P-deglycase FrlB-like protein